MPHSEIAILGKKRDTLAVRRDNHEYIDLFREPASGHQTLCASQIGSSHLTSSPDKLAQRESEVSSHPGLSGSWFRQDQLAVQFEPIVTQQQPPGRLGLSRWGGQPPSLILGICAPSSQ